MYQVKKRNGNLVPFELEKISAAIKKAFQSVNALCIDEIISMLTLKVTAQLTPHLHNNIIEVNDIHNAVEVVLIQSGYTDVSKAYILYRKQHDKVYEASNTLMDYKNLVDKYLKVDDWRVKENSTVTYSLGGLILSNSGAVTANYWLSEIYDDEIGNAHRNADIHIHDLSMLSGYCFTGDTRIKTLDGSNPSFKEMVEKGIDNIDVFSYDIEGQKVVIGKATNPRVTRKVKQLVKITLATKEEILCTPDHPFMLRDGSYIRADELKSNMSLMPLYVADSTKYCTIKVEHIETNEEIEVYDLTVENYHNFALDCGVFVHNCAGWSLKQLIQEGLGGVTGKITSSPAGHLSTLCNQMVNFLGIMQNEWAGAQAFSSFDTYLAPFVKVDNLPYKQVKQCIQSFVYGVNTPSRWGCQAPFTNITLDWTVPNDLAELNAIVGGKEMDFKYKDCKKEMDMVNKAFLEVMIEGDANGRGFQYPIPTYSITRNFDWSETENNKLLFEMTAKYGTPYFSNYINSDMEPSDVRSMAILGTQNIIYKDKFGRISKNEIRHLVNNWIDNPEIEYSVLMNGKFVKVIDMFKVPYEKYDTYVNIKLSNGYEQKFSYDHKCLVVRNGAIIEELAQNVKSTDELLLSRKGYNDSDIGSYEAGKIVGYYLAEGWKSHNNTSLDFAINIDRDDICKEIQQFFEINFAARVLIHQLEEKNIFSVKVYSKAAVEFVNNFVVGDKAIEKHISTLTYDTSLAFRQGIYDGYLVTDGSEKSKTFAHTTNKCLCHDMIELFATIGKYFKYQINSNNTRYFKNDKSDLTKFTSYKLMIYDPKIYNDEYFIVPVAEVENLDASRINTVYNFTVDTPEHIYELPNGIITHQCCRLRLDLRELRKKSGGFFGSGESTGSVGVVTINMPRIAYLSADEEEFFKRLEQLMDIAARSLKIKRTAITKLLEEGLYPYTKRYLGTFNNHFSTIGLVGMNEACLNAKWMRKDMTDVEAQEFTKKTLNFMREKLSDYQEKYGDLYNLEATPAESTSYRFAKHDKEQYPDILTASEADDTPYYTNSSHLPVNYTSDVFSALDIQDELQTLYTSGTVFHAFLGEKLPSWESTAKLVKTIAENYRLPYYTISPTYSVCKDHGYISGEHFECPVCGKTAEVYSRITGYYRPVQNWNDGKLQEYKQRKTYNIATSSYKGTLVDNIEVDNESCEACVVEEPQDILIFTTKTCPNCKMAKMMLDKAGIKYSVVDAEDEKEKTIAYGIRKAPTMLVPNGNGYDRYENASNIKAFIESYK